MECMYVTLSYISMYPVANIRGIKELAPDQVQVTEHCVEISDAQMRESITISSQQKNQESFINLLHMLLFLAQTVGGSYNQL